jgi:hypothetical protein
MYIALHVKCSYFLSDFNELNIFSIDFRKNRPVGAEVLHTDGQTGLTTLIVTFSNFVKGLKQ